MQALTKIRRITKEYGFKIKHKSYSIGQFWRVEDIATAASMAGCNVFKSDDKRVQRYIEFCAAIRERMTQEELADLPERLNRYLQEDVLVF